MLVLAILQAAVAGPLLVGPVIDTPRPPAPACGSTAPDGALIVCGAGQEAFRMRPLPDRYDADAAAIPKAELGIKGVGKVAAEAEQGADAQGGAISRAMVRLKIPF